MGNPCAASCGPRGCSLVGRVGAAPGTLPISYVARGRRTRALYQHHTKRQSSRHQQHRMDWAGIPLQSPHVLVSVSWITRTDCEEAGKPALSGGCSKSTFTDSGWLLTVFFR